MNKPLPLGEIGGMKIGYRVVGEEFTYLEPLEPIRDAKLMLFNFRLLVKCLGAGGQDRIESILLRSYPCDLGLRLQSTVYRLTELARNHSEAADWLAVQNDPYLRLWIVSHTPRMLTAPSN